MNATRVSMIVAASTNNVIGADNGLPWHIPADLRRFKDITMGKPIIMGRRTFESIGKALPGRRSIVVTRNTCYSADDCDVVHSTEDALGLAGDVDEVIVIGGSNIYAQMLPLVDRIYLTRVHANSAGDTFLPPIEFDQWLETEREDVQALTGEHPAFSFLILDRKNDV